MRVRLIHISVGAIADALGVTRNKLTMDDITGYTEDRLNDTYSMLEMEGFDILSTRTHGFSSVTQMSEGFIIEVYVQERMRVDG